LFRQFTTYFIMPRHSTLRRLSLNTEPILSVNRPYLTRAAKCDVNGVENDRLIT